MAFSNGKLRTGKEKQGEISVTKGKTATKGFAARLSLGLYDFPAMERPGQKRQPREFNIEDLLMRQQRELIDERTRAYYRGKVILITGGGGSIGSELCRQLARMEAKQLIVVDIYENCAYDLQQSLRFVYKGKVDILSLIHI